MEPNSNIKTSWKIHSLVAACLLTLSILIAYGFYLGFQLYNLNSPLLNVASEIKQETAAVSLCVEEAMKDQLNNCPKSVLQHLNNAVIYLANLFESEDDKFFGNISKSRNEFYSHIKKLNAEIINLSTFVEDHLNGLNTSLIKNSSSEIQIAFETILDQVDKIEQPLRESITTSKRRFRNVQIFLIMVCVILTVAIVIAFKKHENARKADYLSLIQNNSLLKKEIEDRKKVEKALQESELLTRTVFQTSPDSIIITRQEDHAIIDVNMGFVELTGFQREEVLGKTSLDLNVWQDTAQRKRLINHIEQHEKVHNFEGQFQARNGESKTALISANVIRLNDVPHILYVSRDITEHKKAQTELQVMTRQKEETLALLDAVFDSAPIGLSFWDTDLRFVKLNQAMADINGLPIEEHLGRTVYEVAPDLNDTEEIVECWRRIIESGQPMLNVETIGETQAFTDQMQYWMANWFPVRVNGNTIGIAATVLDITERKQAEKALQQSHSELETKVLQRTIELYRINEQLKNEIEKHKQTEGKLLKNQARLRQMSLKLMQTEERERRRIATEVHDDIGQLLAIVKIKLGTLLQTLRHEDSSVLTEDIRKIVSDVIQKTRSLTFEISLPVLYELGLGAAFEWLIETLATAHDLQIKLDSDGSEESLDDRIKFLVFRSVRELLINAIKHARANRVDVVIRKHQNDITVVVKDDGIGFNIKKLGTQTKGDLSFGLFSVKERLLYYGGKLEIDSSPAMGTRVTIVMPRKVTLDLEGGIKDYDYSNSTGR